jgi:hypothetical protein
LDTSKLKNPKPSHKFFERHLSNDLDLLFDYLVEVQKDILDGKIGDIPKDILSKYTPENGPTTQLGQYYNIFNFENEEIQKLKAALKEATEEACDYYGIDYNTSNYHINGWFNLDFRSSDNIEYGVSPLVDESSYHDHMGGTGAPVFHGYYCVNAEPSMTFYKIDRKEEVFSNINKNNRAILSETGHPHGRDDWYNDKPRITIAYDIAPGKALDSWIKL